MVDILLLKQYLQECKRNVEDQRVGGGLERAERTGGVSGCRGVGRALQRLGGDQ